MAILVLPLRTYGILMERALPVHTSLKFRRKVEKFKSKKRSSRLIEINLEQRDVTELTGLWFTAQFYGEYKGEELRDALQMMVSKEHQLQEPPCIIYSYSEWKAIVEIGSGVANTLPAEAKYGEDKVVVNIEEVFEHLRDALELMIRRAHGLTTTETPIRQRIEEDMMERLAGAEQVEEEEIDIDPALLGANAFGAMEENDPAN